jgi:hypothetical protein
MSITAQKPSRAPIFGRLDGYDFEASIHGYDIVLNAKLVYIARGETTADVRTNAQRAKQWILNQGERAAVRSEISARVPSALWD